LTNSAVLTSVTYSQTDGRTNRITIAHGGLGYHGCLRSVKTSRNT